MNSPLAPAERAWAGPGRIVWLAAEEKPPVQRVERPWGAFEQYAVNQEITVSLMSITPSQRLNLQAYTGRAELWIAVDDVAEVQIGDETLHPKAGEELWTPANTRHRLSAGDGPVLVGEVAFGN